MHTGQPSDRPWISHTGYCGPERRQSLGWAPWVREAIDELDHGVLLLDPERQVVLMNRSALAALDPGHPLQVVDRQLRAHEPKDVAPLHDAVEAAVQRGLRRVVVLGGGRRRCPVALVPLPSRQADGLHACMVTLGRQRASDGLAVQWFAQIHGLTAAESRVLAHLCDGDSPRDVAAALGVGLATVRTQIAAIRSKTQSPDLRSLLQQVACLPPMVSTLYRAAPPVAADPIRLADPPHPRHPVGAGPAVGRVEMAGGAG